MYGKKSGSFNHGCMKMVRSCAIFDEHGQIVGAIDVNPPGRRHGWAAELGVKTGVLIRQRRGQGTSSTNVTRIVAIVTLFSFISATLPATTWRNA